MWFYHHTASLAGGNTAGNTKDLLSSTISGRPWCCISHAPRLFPLFRLNPLPPFPPPAHFGQTPKREERMKIVAEVGIPFRKLFCLIACPLRCLIWCLLFFIFLLFSCFFFLFFKKELTLQTAVCVVRPRGYTVTTAVILRPTTPALTAIKSYSIRPHHNCSTASVTLMAAAPADPLLTQQGLVLPQPSTFYSSLLGRLT